MLYAEENYTSIKKQFLAYCEAGQEIEQLAMESPRYHALGTPHGELSSFRSIFLMYCPIQFANILKIFASMVFSDIGL